jgi:hypothetical protein
MRLGRLVCTIAFTVGLAGPLAAQTENGDEPSSRATIRVFFDCNAGGCYDVDFFHREIPYVNWVTDRTVADVHVLITGQTTGGGGQQYQLTFLGIGAFDGQDDTLVVNTPGASTQDERRTAIAEKLKLGLVRYLSQTSAAEMLRVVYGRPGGPGGRPGPGGPGPGRGGYPAASAQDDPWDYWVFSVSGRLSVNGQSSYNTSNYSTSVSANRTTEAWKLSVRLSYNLEKDHYDLTSGVLDERQRSWDLSPFAVRSVGKQWAVGAKANLGHSDFYNQRTKWSLQPGLEFNVFPYSESSRRSLTFQYLVGPQHFDYQERTIYEKDKETLVQESLTAGLSLVQPWGQWSTSLTGAHYPSQTSKYHVSLDGYVNVRLFKGFSVNASAYYTWIHDQLYLSAGGVTDEQTLLHLRQLYTTKSYYTSVGISYRFGSIFNNVVNTRFGGSNSGIIIIG